MKLRLSARAASDLRQILDYLDTQNPRAAKSVRFSIRRAFDIVTSFPANRSCANAAFASTSSRNFPITIQSLSNSKRFGSTQSVTLRAGPSLAPDQRLIQG